MEQDRVMLTVRIPRELRKRLRRHAIDRETTLEEIVAEWCNEKLAKAEAAGARK